MLSVVIAPPSPPQFPPSHKPPPRIYVIPARKWGGEKDECFAKEGEIRSANSNTHAYFPPKNFPSFLYKELEMEEGTPTNLSARQCRLKVKEGRERKRMKYCRSLSTLEQEGDLFSLSLRLLSPLAPVTFFRTLGGAERKGGLSQGEVIGCRPLLFLSRQWRPRLSPDQFEKRRERGYFPAGNEGCPKEMFF